MQARRVSYGRCKAKSEPAANAGSAWFRCAALAIGMAKARSYIIMLSYLDPYQNDIGCGRARPLRADLVVALLPSSYYNREPKGDRMPKPASVFDLPPDEATEDRADAAAEADVEAGSVVSHERAREWLMRLVKGERVPPPST